MISGRIFESGGFVVQRSAAVIGNVDAVQPVFEAQPGVLGGDNPLRQHRHVHEWAQFVKELPFVPQPFVADPIRLRGAGRRAGLAPPPAGRVRFRSCSRALKRRCLLVHGHDDGPAPRRLDLLQDLPVLVQFPPGIKLKPYRALRRRRDLFDGQAGDVARNQRRVRGRRASDVRGGLTLRVEGPMRRRWGPP